MIRNGVINVFKPTGMTSSDVVYFLRKKLGMKKIGHIGTLDPNASGALPVVLGSATKLSDYIYDKEKAYRAEITFGIETDSNDTQGEILNTSDIRPELNNVIEEINNFCGEIEQIPPIYSAIKVDGKKLYQYARKDKNVDIPKRKVEIFDFDIINTKIIDGKVESILVDIICGKGTYIRSIARDLAHNLGTCGVLTFLSRRKSGYFDIEKGYSPQEIEEMIQKENYNFIEKPDVYIDMHEIIIDNKKFELFINGGRINIEHCRAEKKEEGLYKAYCNDNFLGIAQLKGNTVKLSKRTYKIYENSI